MQNRYVDLALSERSHHQSSLFVTSLKNIDSRYIIPGFKRPGACLKKLLENHLLRENVCTGRMEAINKITKRYVGTD